MVWDLVVNLSYVEEYTSVLTQMSVATHFSLSDLLRLEAINIFRIGKAFQIRLIFCVVVQKRTSNKITNASVMFTLLSNGLHFFLQPGAVLFQVVYT